MSDGVIYVATGADYADLAIQSARSLRESNPGIAVDLFTDMSKVQEMDVFDQIHAVPRVHERAKLDCLSLSRFDRTLFLDADTLVVGDLGDMWTIADQFDLAMAHEVWRASDLIQQGHVQATPYGFPQLNSGVILYRNSQSTTRFFADWGKLFYESRAARDQIILKDLLWTTDIRFYVLPCEFNMRRLPLLDASEPPDFALKIVHSHRLMDHMRIPSAARIRSLPQLLAAERRALRQAWRERGDPDHVAWFTGGYKKGPQRG